MVGRSVNAGASLPGFGSWLHWFCALRKALNFSVLQLPIYTMGMTIILISWG